MSRRAYRMIFRATRPEGEVRRVRNVYADNYAEAEATATRHATALLRGTELDWDVDVECPPGEVLE